MSKTCWHVFGAIALLNPVLPFFLAVTQPAEFWDAYERLWRSFRYGVRP